MKIRLRPSPLYSATLVIGFSFLQIALIYPSSAQSPGSNYASSGSNAQNSSLNPNMDLSGGTNSAEAGQAGQSGQSGQSGSRGGARWRALSPEQRAAVIQRIRERRAAQQNESDVPGVSRIPSSGNSFGGISIGGMRGRGGANVPPPANLNDVSIQSDVAYGKAPLQKLDIYTSKVKGAAPLPILVFVHGGGWSRGDKSQRDHKAKGCAYVADGVIFVSVDYRLAPDVMHPKQVQDIASAVAYVKEHASNFGGDPNRIYLMGHSAGAHLVDLLGTNDKYLSEVGLGLKDIKGVISLDTASLNLQERTKDEALETKMVGPMVDTAFGKDPAVLKDGSPTLSIHPGKTYPPFLMFYGSRRLNCVQQHKEFSDAMTKAGGQVSLIPIPLSHADINLAAGNPQHEVYKQIIKMINPEPRVLQKTKRNVLGAT